MGFIDAPALAARPHTVIRTRCDPTEVGPLRAGESLKDPYTAGCRVKPLASATA